MQFARSGAVQFRTDLPNGLDVIITSEALGEQQSLTVGLAQDVFQLAGAIGGIYVYQNCAELRSCKLTEHPLRRIRGPNSDAISLLNAEAQEAACSTLHFLPKFPIGIAQFLMAHDQAIVVGIFRCGIIEHLADTLAQ